MKGVTVMKKIIASALLLAAVFALCACGETTVIEKEVRVEVPVEIPVIPEEYRKYQDMVDALEAGDYDAAIAFVDAMAPPQEIPPVMEVEITAENFLDYFEYVELPENNFWTQNDSKGKLSAITFRSGYYLKDGYVIAPERVSDCHLDVGMKYDLYWYYKNKKITVDIENHAYKTSGNPGKNDIMHCDRMCTGAYRWGDQPLYYVSVADTRLEAGKGTSCIVPQKNFKFVSVSGVLYLRG